MCVCSSLDKKLADLKKRRSGLMDSLKSPMVEVVKPQKAGEKKTPHISRFSLLIRASLLCLSGLFKFSERTFFFLFLISGHSKLPRRHQSWRLPR